MAKKTSTKRVSKSPAAGTTFGIMLAVAVAIGLWYVNQGSISTTGEAATTQNASPVAQNKQLKNDKDLNDLDAMMNSVDADKDFGSDLMVDLEVQ